MSFEQNLQLWVIKSHTLREVKNVFCTSAGNSEMLVFISVFFPTMPKLTFVSFFLFFLHLFLTKNRKIKIIQKKLNKVKIICSTTAL